MGNDTVVILSAAEVAEHYGRPLRTIQHWAQAGRLPATKLPGATGAYVFVQSDLPSEAPRER